MGIVCCANCGHQHSGLRTGCPQCGMKPGQVLSHRSTGRAQAFRGTLLSGMIDCSRSKADQQ